MLFKSIDDKTYDSKHERQSMVELASYHRNRIVSSVSKAQVLVKVFRIATA
jgi:hypothetical protein